MSNISFFTERMTERLVCPSLKGEAMITLDRATSHPRNRDFPGRRVRTEPQSLVRRRGVPGECPAGNMSWKKETADRDFSLGKQTIHKLLTDKHGGYGGPGAVPQNGTFIHPRRCLQTCLQSHDASQTHRPQGTCPDSSF